MSDERRILDKTGKLLLDAADYIEAHGHCKRTLWAKDGRVCALGALHRAAEATAPKAYSWLEAMAIDAGVEMMVFAAARRLARHINTDAIETWNDRKHRTKDDVIVALREAAIAK